MTDPVRYFMGWSEVYARLRSLGIDPQERVFGIPRGGMVVAGLTGSATDTPESATVFVDDIVDSGRTRDRWLARFPDRQFLALVDKQGADRDLGWVVFPWEHRDTTQDGEDVVARMLEFIGEDPTREGLKETPSRVVRSWAELFAGYQQYPQEVMKVFEEGACREMVVLRDIDYYSTCEHHLIPFFGKAHIGYLPSGKIVGLSKLARLVDMFARRLQVQERMTAQVADALMEHLQPRGAIVVVEGSHLCMMARGVEKQNGRMTTAAIRGAFEAPEVRAEFYSLIKGGG